MAKQSGLHQIRGKVGEHSYYKQTGVESGLIRSINQGLSDRVKTGAEYANTRLNNAEFGQACRIAGVLGQFVIPKYRPMILPFSQSKMAKILLEAIKTKTGNWGQRNLGTTDIEVFLEAINSTHKNNPSDWGVRYIVDDNDNFIVEFDENVFNSKLEAIGANGVIVQVIAARPWIGTYVAGDGKYANSFARSNVYSGSVGEGDERVVVDYEFRPAPPSGWPATYVDFFVVVLLPFRTVNSVDHTLQEHCTFEAIGIPDGE